ncbi:peptide-N(4)-(N-acetyl-beta-glucosaminyl)asparagine amidase [Phymastichus coffea]|uniref:peptide-N(4)-(N-acetyl-beta- glucosaminyl)asparagine amidase n=1 Tax=Phymastichus coffea TaxID=108790 RepID=UPI00273C351C|nr:peptide-N(4)-(N-acetyl-beta-glucosaminyl)asparagine amidase [Phymastichus coffea]XP_058793998.1 peptide-N(4)-(N-acetyl-beta-glucosaminyl)asparagine amidase [Phymastichus coffea]
MKMQRISDNIVFEDFFLKELLNWFKFKFFKWVDTLSCHNCMGECYNNGSRVSSYPQISRIEIHKCKICKYENEFPRYTDPEALLYSRKGRCGEWANCFTLICRSIGFDARLVYDDTDHVWTEIWSVAHNRWIHADACEAVMDQPLIYEKGWGKKLSYIIAFSKDEIQDVTWRYTRNYEQAMKLRKYCSEETLALFLRKLNEERQTSEGYSSVRRKFVLKRCVIELANMINAPPGHEKSVEDYKNEADYVGRTSGSLAWRMSRGEFVSPTHEVAQWYIPDGIAKFELTYDVTTDTYTTINIATKETLETRQKWQKGVEHVDGNIFRKEELDWKMVYLARSPGFEFGKITWTLMVTENSKAYIKSVKLQAQATTFSGAVIQWQVEGFFAGKTIEKRKVLAVDDCQNFETVDLWGAVKISVSAILTGDTGDLSWQHAQLFRQSLNKHHKREPSLLIQVELANLSG